MATKEKEEENNPQNERIFLIYKVVKQVTFTSLWLALGLCFGINGPCLPDLMQYLSLNIEEVSRGVTGISIGFLIGSILGGLFFTLFYRFSDLMVAVSMFVCAVGLGFVPWTRSLVHLFLCFFLVGLSGGWNNSGVNTLVLHLWGKVSGPPMYLMHLGFGVGGFLAPQVARPFITEANIMETNVMAENNTVLDTYKDLKNYTENTNDFAMETNQTKLENKLYSENLLYPYSILSGISFLLSIVMLIFFIKGTPRNFPSAHIKVPIRKLFSPKMCAGNFPCYGVLILFLMFFMFFQAVGGELIYGNFIYSYARETKVAFSKDQAATLTSLFWLAHMAGRFVGAVIEILVPTSVILLGDVTLLILTALGLVAFGSSNATMLWILTFSFGFLISPIYPAGMVWANAYLRVNSMSTMILVLGSSIGLSFYVYTAGYFFEHYGPKSIMYFLVACSAGLLVILIALVALGRRLHRLQKEENSRNENQLKELVKAED